MARSIAAQEYGRYFTSLHRAIKTHGCDSDEADQIRIKMDQYWYSMTEEEKHTYRVLSEMWNRDNAQYL